MFEELKKYTDKIQEIFENTEEGKKDEGIEKVNAEIIKICDELSQKLGNIEFFKPAIPYIVFVLTGLIDEMISDMHTDEDDGNLIMLNHLITTFERPFQGIYTKTLVELEKNVLPEGSVTPAFELHYTNPEKLVKGYFDKQETNSANSKEQSQSQVSEDSGVQSQSNEESLSKENAPATESNTHAGEEKSESKSRFKPFKISSGGIF